MSKSNTTENNLLLLIFNATAWANMADNAASSPLTSLYVALHTGDPGEGGTATTSESAYTNYARVAVARTAGGWTVSGATVTNAGAIAFPTCGVTGSTVTYFSVTVASSGSTTILYSGQLISSLAISNGITPSFGVGQLTVTED